MKFILGIIFAAVASATPVVVSFDTSTFAAGTYYLDYQLVSGDNPIGNGNNTVTLNTFQTGGGMLGVVQLDGGASGTVASGFTIADNAASGFNGVLLSLTPGSLLSFTLDYTNNFTSGLPDEFSFAILDNAGASIVSAGNQALLTIDLGSANPPALLPSDGGVSVTISGVPEPASFLLLAPALAVGLWHRNKRHRNQ